MFADMGAYQEVLQGGPPLLSEKQFFAFRAPKLKTKIVQTSCFYDEIEDILVYTQLRYNRLSVVSDTNCIAQISHQCAVLTSHNDHLLNDF